MVKYWRYFKALMRHKWFVFIEACKLGIPWLGLIHDASKLHPSEFLSYSRNFYGGGSPADREHEVAFDYAWNRHQKRNKHHWQRWILVNDSDEPQTVFLEMPKRYALEMIADWRGAGRAYGNPDTLGWYTEHRHRIMLHPATRALVECELDDTSIGNHCDRFLDEL